MEVAYDMAAADVNENFAESVPMHIRNAPTKLMKDLGYSKNYQYAHNTEDKITKMSCLPDSLKDRCYYNPAGMGAEAKLKKRAQAIREWKKGITDVNPFSV
jgi:putative ATPase